MSKVQSEPFKEMRRHQRKSIETYVSLFDGKTLVFSNASDISEGGMCLRSDTALNVGDSLELRFFLPSGEFISTRSKVAHASQAQPGGYIAGIEFVSITEQAQSRIGAYVLEP